MLARRLAIVSAALLCACDGAPGEDLRPPNQLRANPADNSTGLPTLWVTLTGDPSGRYEDDLERVATSSELVTWPDLVPVPAHIDRTPTYFTEAFGVWRAVVADQPPPDGWYALLMGGISPGAILADSQFHELLDGRWAVRVRKGSAPQLWGYAACPKEGARTAIVVRYSEQLHAATTAATPLFLRAGAPGKELDCESLDGPFVDRYMTDYEFICGELGPKDQVILEVQSGLVSPDGIEVPPAERTLALDHLVPSTGIGSGGCSSLKVDP
jgi:hypothetical protein